ncbi:MAG: 50S ribosomal protein L18 [Desulfatiglandales bacterium]
MGTGPRYIVSHRRKRSGKTDYRSRMKLLMSGKPRLVVRITSNRVITQVINYTEKGDVVATACNSNDLRDFGWKAATSNTPSAYLTGLLCGRKAVGMGIKSCIFDVGRVKPLAGTKIFAVLKGALDGGLEIPHSEESLPSEDRLAGSHITNYAGSLKADKKKPIFSEYKKRGLDPKEVPKHFEAVKNDILKKGKEIKTEKPKKKASKGKKPSS